MTRAGCNEDSGCISSWHPLAAELREQRRQSRNDGAAHERYDSRALNVFRKFVTALDEIPVISDVDIVDFSCDTGSQ